MYRFGRRIQKRKHRPAWLIASLAALFIIVAALGIYGKSFLPGNTVIHQSAAVVSVVKVHQATTHVLNGGDFTIALPVNWSQVPGQVRPYHIIRFQAAVNHSDEQQLDVYEDTVPLNFAINRVLPVAASGAQLSTLGNASDNCDDFTKSASTLPTSAGTPAKWAGVSFLCDLNNTERDVVGTGSTDGVNKVTLKGPISGTHSFFFSYTDNNISPDYTMLYGALDSFRLK